MIHIYRACKLRAGYPLQNKQSLDKSYFTCDLSLCKIRNSRWTESKRSHKESKSVLWFCLGLDNRSSCLNMINERKLCHNSRYFLVARDDLYLMGTGKTWIFYNLRWPFRSIWQISFRQFITLMNDFLQVAKETLNICLFRYNYGR